MEPGDIRELQLSSAGLTTVWVHDWGAFIMAVGHVSGTGNVARLTSHRTENQLPW